MNPSETEIVATLCFALAIVHTFFVSRLHRLSLRFTSGSAGENIFRLLGEIEIVFGVWGAVFLSFLAVKEGGSASIHYLENRNFTEAGFVFVIMSICSARPIRVLAGWLIESLSGLLPGRRSIVFYATTLVVGPLLGSFITEPAAMTVTAIILFNQFFSKAMSPAFKYSTLGLLFVNVSIGGTLTSYAAPPVLMVAAKWEWDTSFMLSHFGWKALIAILISTMLVTYRFRGELTELAWPKTKQYPLQSPIWVSLSHLILLGAVVAASHYMVLFVGIFLFFLGLFSVSQKYQEPLRLREGLLVAFFLAGLVVLGGPQSWWLSPLLSRLQALPLFLSAASLTAITDNAALTYLGSQVPGLGDLSKFALVAGSVVGGGLTVIANTPNPAGYGILNPTFGDDGINPFLLFTHALLPTLIAGLCYWVL